VRLTLIKPVLRKYAEWHSMTFCQKRIYSNWEYYLFDSTCQLYEHEECVRDNKMLYCLYQF